MNDYNTEFLGFAYYDDSCQRRGVFRFGIRDAVGITGVPEVCVRTRRSEMRGPP